MTKKLLTRTPSSTMLILWMKVFLVFLGMLNLTFYLLVLGLFSDAAAPFDKKPINLH